MKSSLSLSLSLSAAASALLIAAPALAEPCALDDPAFVAPANDSGRPADDVVLMSIGLDAAGQFAVKSASRANGVVDYAWQLPAMAAELAAHAAPAEAVTPFDMVLSRDTVVVFRLEPGAWEWEADPAKAIYLKDAPARHDPFTAIESVGGNPRLLAVRFHAPAALGGCSYSYDLGVVVKQGARRTPLVIDPKIQNGGIPP